VEPIWFISEMSKVDSAELERMKPREKKAWAGAMCDRAVARRQAAVAAWPILPQLLDHIEKLHTLQPKGARTLLISNMMLLMVDEIDALKADQIDADNVEGWAIRYVWDFAEGNIAFGPLRETDGDLPTSGPGAEALALCEWCIQRLRDSGFIQPARVPFVSDAMRKRVRRGRASGATALSAAEVDESDDELDEVEDEIESGKFGDDVEEGDDFLDDDDDLDEDDLDDDDGFDDEEEDLPPGPPPPPEVIARLEAIEAEARARIQARHNEHERGKGL
jgi:hypothetical protein